MHPEQWIEAGLEAGLLSEEDAAFMRTHEAEVLEMLTVDDFDFDAFTNQQPSANHARQTHTTPA
nr:hypothetical protein [Salinicola tamaricis]